VKWQTSGLEEAQVMARASSVNAVARRGRWDQFVQHPQVRRRLVGGHLDRRRPAVQGSGEEAPAGVAVPLLTQEYVDYPVRPIECQLQTDRAADGDTGVRDEAVRRCQHGVAEVGDGERPVRGRAAAVPGQVPAEHGVRADQLPGAPARQRLDRRAQGRPDDEQRSIGVWRGEPGPGQLGPAHRRAARSSTASTSSPAAPR
jgi:hypothetical protein